MEAMGGTNGCAGWLETLIHSILAVVTFDHFPGVGIPLGSPPRACRHTTLAAHAESRFHKNDSVFCSLLHGSRRAGCNTPRILAVKTRHENIGGLGQVINDFGPHPDDIGGSGIREEVFVAFACNRAAITGNALFLVLIKIIDAHDLPPSASGFDRDLRSPCVTLFIIFLPDSPKKQNRICSQTEDAHKKSGPLDFSLEVVYISTKFP
jgi:hypothetical protein